MGYIFGVMLGLYRHNGKENGNYHYDGYILDLEGPKTLNPEPSTVVDVCFFYCRTDCSVGVWQALQHKKRNLNFENLKFG